jgi:hypothetical protein
MFRGFLLFGYGTDLDAHQRQRTPVRRSGTGHFVAGDMNTFGVVYMSTAGRGIGVGKPYQDTSEATAAAGHAGRQLRVAFRIRFMKEPIFSMWNCANLPESLLPIHPSSQPCNHHLKHTHRAPASS